MLRVSTNRAANAALSLSRRHQTGTNLWQGASRRVYGTPTSTAVVKPPTVLPAAVRRAAPWAGATVVIGCTWLMTLPKKAATTVCEAQFADPTPEALSLNTRVSVRVKDHDHDGWWQTVKRGYRVIKRIIKLMIALSPIVALYPFQYLLTQATRTADDDAQEIVLSSLERAEIPDGPVGWYYRMCLQCVEWSGAAAIKIMQWAGSRPDMFGQAFCSVFSQLQDHTTPHAWKHTEKMLREAYGDDWHEHIQLNEIIGSGCIAQVYKGVIVDDDGKEQEIAVKVMHPSVIDDIDADMDIMRLTAYLVETSPFDVLRNLKWLNLSGFVEEMAAMLRIQLDLRTEADHLRTFNENFKDDDTVVFPKLVKGYEPSKDVLIETFCEGVPVLEFVRNNTTDRKLLTELCKGAIKAVCQMIFLDNFIHGDLHPGNVLISKDLKFVLLDVGIVVENSDSDHRLISDILAAFIRRQGRRAGELMMDDSNSRLLAVGDHSRDEKLFLDKIELISIRAASSDYLMEHLGSYIAYICNAAAVHHVMLNQAFISAALAVKVQEGIALALDPSVQIWKVATPIILEGERRHGLVAERAKEALGIEGILDWFRGSGNDKKDKA